MKNKLLLLTLSCVVTTSLQALAQDAAEAEVTEAQTFMYNLVCTSNDEMMANDSLLTQIGSDPAAIQEATNMRDGFQKFAADPATSIKEQIPVKDEALMQQAIQLVTQQIPAQALQAMANEYAAANSVSAEEAMMAVLKERAEVAIDNYITSTIVSVTSQNCGLLNTIQPLITKSGCKSVSGATLDLSVASGVCQSISTQLADLANAEAAIGQIQSRMNQAIQFLQQGAQAQINPIAESMDAPISDIVNVINELIAPKVEEGAAPSVSAPAAP